MKYENRPPPEGINVSDQHPLVDFASMLVIVGVISGVLIATLSFSAGWLAQQIPFAQEQRWASTFSPDESAQRTDEHTRIETWLQQLVDALAEPMSLQPSMQIKVRYVSDDNIVNAYATIGGNVVIFSGLLKKLDSENAVAMVLAHEIAHIKHRDPVVALGRSTAIVLGLTAMGGVSDSAMAQQVIGNVSLLTALSFSRAQEGNADEEAITALQSHYGHLNGASSLFTLLAQQQDEQLSASIPEFLKTHPLTETRIERINASAMASPKGTTTPLPQWLEIHQR